MSQCRSCKAPVVWARTTHGRSVPLDAEDMGGWEAPLHVDDGNLKPTGDRVPAGAGQTVMVVRYVRAGEGDLRTHFATCPDASSWRKDRS